MTEVNFDIFPNLETEKLKLRKICMDDARDVFELRTNKKAMKYIKKPEVKSIDDAKEIIKKMNETVRIQWGITFKKRK